MQRATDAFASLASDAFGSLRRSNRTSARPMCPYMAGGAGSSSASAADLPPGHPPLPGMMMADTDVVMADAPSAEPPVPTLPPALAETVKTMAERGGQTAEAIAQMLNLDLAAVKATLEPPESGALPPIF